MIKATINKYFEALKKEDINMMDSTLDATFESDELTKDQYLANIQASFILVDINESKVVFDTITISNNTATANCVVAMTATVFDQTVTETGPMDFTMIQNGNSWLIKGIDDNVE